MSVHGEFPPIDRIAVGDVELVAVRAGKDELVSQACRAGVLASRRTAGPSDRTPARREPTLHTRAPPGPPPSRRPPTRGGAAVARGT